MPLFKDQNFQYKERNLKRVWSVERVFRSMDLFGKDVPAFNINGDPKFKSVLGGGLTFILFCIIFFFSVNTFQQMIDRQYPSIQYSEIQQHFNGTHKLSLNEANYRIAFTFEGELDKKIKNDEKFVKILVRVNRKTDGVISETVVNYHKCTE